MVVVCECLCSPITCLALLLSLFILLKILRTMNNNTNNIVQDAFAAGAEDPTEPLEYEGPSEEGLRKKIIELREKLAFVSHRRHELTQTIIERDIELEECYEEQQRLYHEFDRLDQEILQLRLQIEIVKEKGDGRCKRLRDYITQREIHTREVESENKRLLRELWDARIRLQEMDAQVKLLATSLKKDIVARAPMQSPLRQPSVVDLRAAFLEEEETPKQQREPEAISEPSAPIKNVKLWPENTPGRKHAVMSTGPRITVTEFIERKRAANTPVPYGVRVQRDLLAEFPPQNDYEARVRADMLREQEQMSNVERHDNPGVYRSTKEAWENWRKQRDEEEALREAEMHHRHQQGLLRSDGEQAAFERATKTQYKLRARAPKKYRFE